MDHQEQEQLQFFFFPLLARGHITPMVHLARLLAKRGIHATLVTTPGNVSYVDSVDDTIQILTIPFPDVGLPPGCENASDLTTEMGNEGLKMMCRAATLLQQPFEDLLRNHRPDCVISDWAFVWPAAASLSLDVPHVTFRPSCAFTASVMEHMATAEACGSSTDPLAGLPHRLLRIEESELEPNKQYVEYVTNLADSAENNSLGVIMDTCRDLEGEYVELLQEKKRKVWCSGPLHLQHKICNNDKWGESEGSNRIKKWLDSKHPESVLYVCFGSECQFGHDQLREIASGLESSGQSFIWVVRSGGGIKGTTECWLPEGFEEKVGERGLVITEWAPQVSILNHPSTGGCITHGGWNSALETVGAGLPMIVWPLGADQFFNERLFVDVLGIGVRLLDGDMRIMDPDKKKLVSPEKVKEVVMKLFGNTEEAREMRRKAKEYGKLARLAIEEGGSSYHDVTCLIKEITLLAQAKSQSNPKC